MARLFAILLIQRFAFSSRRNTHLHNSYDLHEIRSNCFFFRKTKQMHFGTYDSNFFCHFNFVFLIMSVASLHAATPCPTNSLGEALPPCWAYNIDGPLTQAWIQLPYQFTKHNSETSQRHTQTDFQCTQSRRVHRRRVRTRASRSKPPECRIYADEAL